MVGGTIGVLGREDLAEKSMSAAGQQQTPNDRRNWKLLVDPLLKKGLPKLYRFDGHCPPGHGVS